MKKVLTMALLLAAVFAITLALPTQPTLDAVPCCQGSYQSSAHYYGVGDDCDEAEADLIAQAISEAQATCNPSIPCGVTTAVQYCSYYPSIDQWIMCGKLSWGCRENCGPPPM